MEARAVSITSKNFRGFSHLIHSFTVDHRRLDAGGIGFCLNVAQFDLPKVNTGDPEALIDFITWARLTYPAERYGLVLWNHGTGCKGEDTYQAARHRAHSTTVRSLLARVRYPLAETGQNRYLDLTPDDASIGLAAIRLDRNHHPISPTLPTAVGGDSSLPGLHQRDNARLLRTLKDMRDLGNTVLVVEHDEGTIRSADHIPGHLHQRVHLHPRAFRQPARGQAAGLQARPLLLQRQGRALRSLPG